MLQENLQIGEWSRRIKEKPIKKLSLNFNWKIAGFDLLMCDCSGEWQRDVTERGALLMTEKVPKPTKVTLSPFFKAPVNPEASILNMKWI